MKTKYSILYILFCLTLFVSCTAEDALPFEGEGTEGKSDLTQVMFSVSLPLHDLPTATRSVSIGDDSAIQNLRIWTFDGSGDNAAFTEEITTDSKDAQGNKKLTVIDGSDGKKQVFVLLPRSETAVTLCVIVNASATTPNLGTEKIEACSAAKMEYSVGTVEVPMTHMPMYGECVLPQVERGTKMDLALVRAMAKIEINAAAIADIFQIESVQIFNVNTKGTVNDQGAVSSPGNHTELKTLQTSNRNTAVFHLPERATVGSEETSQANKTYILVKAKYRGQAATWYRLEFISSSTGLPVSGGIQRNCKYAFVLQNATGTGYSTEDEAKNGKAHNTEILTMEVQQIDDQNIRDITTDDAYYLGVTSSEIKAQKSQANGNYVANLSVVCNNREGWNMILDELNAIGAQVTQRNWNPSGTVEVQSVWFFFDASKVTVGQTYKAYVYSGTIRKTIQIEITSDEI